MSTQLIKAHCWCKFYRYVNVKNLLRLCSWKPLVQTFHSCQMSMLHHIFSKKLIHLLNVTGKVLTCQNLNLISSGWNTKFVMQFKQAQCLPLPRFCEKPSCKLPSRTWPSIMTLGTNSIWLEITHVIDMVLPCNHKGIAP